MPKLLKRQDLIHPELSYKIIGILFEAYNDLGHGLQEKYYQRAVALRLKQVGIKFLQQVKVNLKFKNNNIGNYFLDFLIDDKNVKIKTSTQL